jgi:hypothetical protein
MKVRQAYEGRVIEARSSELKDGGWDCEFSIEEHETTGVTERAFYVPGVFPTAEAAIEAAVKRDSRKLIQASRTNPLSSIGSEKCRVGSCPFLVLWLSYAEWSGFTS